MEFSGEAKKAHIIAIPLPFQGHINPMMQLCKRLVSKGIKVTMMISTSIPNVAVKDEHMNSVDIELLEEYTGEVDAPSGTISNFLQRYRKTITSKLDDYLVEIKASSSGEAVKVILYDSLITWCLDIAQSLGIPAAVFFTQSCAVANIYTNIFREELEVPLTENKISLYSMPEMEANDLPSFLLDSNAYPGVLEANVSQINSLEKANWVLFNSFDELEFEVLSHMRKFYQIMTVGPTIPSLYLDKRLKEDKAYSFNFFQSAKDRCMKWLDTKGNASVVYVSFGSLSDLKQDQTDNIASGIIRSNRDFLWIVRASEQNKLPSSLMSVAEDRGLILDWCPQVQVLAHKAIGCFITHCGWNSTLEGLSLGVPMVALPLWIDQPTNAKYIADVWKVGCRAMAGEDGVFSSDEVESSITKAMYGENENEMKKNALKWKEIATKAMSEGGSSDQCIQEFVLDVKALD